MVPEPTQIPYTYEGEAAAARAVADALIKRGIDAKHEFLGFGTPVMVQVSDDAQLYFQGWGQDGGWYASRHELDADGLWGPDENEETAVELPHLAGVQDIEQIADAIAFVVQVYGY